MGAHLDAASDAYLSIKPNFGPDTRAMRVAEDDAFRAGWEAATRLLGRRLRNPKLYEDVIRVLDN